jgi:APA family basic amino acid/polyamine antiporter
MANIERKLSGFTATSLIVTSMVGTGIFTSTGYQIKDLESVGAILLAWVLGGVTALCGALTYAELVTLIPKNGGEYQLLSRIYHPAIGFLMGWTSLTVGFGAPIAAVAFAFGTYCNALFPFIPARESGLVLIVLLSVIHGLSVDRSTRFQNYFTVLKILLVVFMITFGFAYSDPSLLFVESPKRMLEATFSSKFSVGLIYVAFAYSGWNAAAYVAGEVQDPSRTLPRAFFGGTVIVMILYVLVNIVFLSAAPMSELSGKVEIGHVVAIHLFGETAGKLLSGIIALGLLSTVGAMILTGARVLEAMGEDYPRLKFLSHRRPNKGPWRAIVLQSGVAIVLLMLARFDTLIEYTGFTVTAGLSVSVFAIFVARKRSMTRPGAYRVWAYPWPPIIYGLLALWMVLGMIVERPWVSLAGVSTLVVGLVLYFVIQRANP